MKSLLFISFMLIFSFVQAQPRVITFDSEQVESEAKEETNVIKINPIELLASGDYSLYYEKALFNQFSAEIGLGFTFVDNWGDLASETNYYQSLREDKIGFSFGGELRFYPSELFEDFYISAGYKYRKYLWDREVVELTPDYKVITKQVDESRRHSNTKINFGYIFFLTNQISIDPYLGLGINFVKEVYYNTADAEIEEFYPGARPKLNGGVKIAYLF